MFNLMLHVPSGVTAQIQWLLHLHLRVVTFPNTYRQQIFEERLIRHLIARIVKSPRHIVKLLSESY